MWSVNTRYSSSWPNQIACAPSRESAARRMHRPDGRIPQWPEGADHQAMRQFTQQFVVVVAPLFDAAEDVVVVQPAESIQPLRIGIEIRSLDRLTKEAAASCFRGSGAIRMKFPCPFEDHARRNSAERTVLCKYTCQYIKRRAMINFSTGRCPLHRRQVRRPRH